MERIDIELVNRNMFETRARAQLEIKNGRIYCNSKKIKKASFKVNDTDKIEVVGEVFKYVSKGGLKLEKAIIHFNINLNDKILLDIGSSTGGFTDCAIQNGIKKVYAIDVGNNQLDKKLRINPKVKLYENIDFRNIDNNIIIDANIATIDVAFISVSKLILKINELNNITEIICLIKPQFECGKKIADIYKGVPLNKNIHINVIKDIIKQFKDINYFVQGLTYSPIRGGNGNIEYLLYICKNCNENNIGIEQVVINAFNKL